MQEHHPFDVTIPRRYVFPLAAALDYPRGELGDRFGEDAPPETHEEAVAWYERKEIPEQFLVGQAISGLVSPVYVWQLQITGRKAQMWSLHGTLPDFDGYAPPFLVRRSSDGENLEILRVTDMQALAETALKAALPLSTVADANIRVHLDVDQFLCLTLIVDTYLDRCYHSLLHREPYPERITVEDMKKLLSRGSYPLDDRRAFPAALKTCRLWPGDWTDRDYRPTFKHLAEEGLIQYGEGDGTLFLTDMGYEVMGSFAYGSCVVRSARSTSASARERTDSAQWILRTPDMLLLVELGALPVRSVILRSVDHDGLMTYFSKPDHGAGPP